MVKEETMNIISSIIQWLGSPVGRNFLSQVLEVENDSLFPKFIN